jgi:hypothetical protein
MHNVWIRTHNDACVRADSIVILENNQDGLYAECLNGSRVQLTPNVCPPGLQLALLEEIRHAGADDSRAVVIMPAWEQDSPAWHRESADTLADRLNEHENKARKIGVAPVPHGNAG